MSTFGTRLKQLRKENRLTQKQLAEKLYIDDTSISKYENNKAMPENELLQRIADIFSVTVDYLLGRETFKHLKTPSPENMFSGTGKSINSKNEYQPQLTEKDEKDLDKVMINFEKGLEGNIMLDGEILDEQTKELFLASVRHAYEFAKINNKAKYTPKKYRK